MEKSKGNLKYINKLYLSLIFVMISFLVAGCSQANSFQKSIYDDVSKITAMGDSYSFFSRSGDFYNNNFSISFKGFRGKQTLWKLTADEDCVSMLDFNLEVESGKFKICLINTNKEVVLITEGTSAGVLAIDIQKGDNYIAIVGNEANGKANISLTENEKITVTQIAD